MESESILSYLQDILETKQISSTAKLASLSILNKLFLKKQGTSLQLHCVQSGLASSLLTMLDSGLNGISDPSETVMISVAMEILCQLSKLPVCSIQSLLTEPVIRTLLDYLNCNSKFYQFPAQIKKAMSEVCEGKQLMGKVKVVSMATEPLEYIHRHTKHKLKRVPDKIKVCKLINTEHEEDLDISDYLLKNQLAWPGNFPGDVVSESNDWEDIIVTRVLDGGMFWAQIGENSIKRVFDIQRQLNNNNNVKHVRGTPSLIGDTVVVYGEIMGSPCFLRAQVLAFDGSTVEVFAIDYGYTLRVSDRNIFQLPENLNIKNMKRSISLCSLDGFTPPPYDAELAHNAAAILVNLCKQSFLTGEMIEKLDGFSTIRSLIEYCSLPKLKAQVITVLLNLAVNYRVNTHIINGGFIKLLLDIIESYTQVECVDYLPETESTFLLPVTNDDKLLIARTVMCLTNIIHGNTEARSQFYKHQGIDIILSLLMCMTPGDAIYMFCVKLLKAFLGRSAQHQAGDIRGQPDREGKGHPRGDTRGPSIKEGHNYQSRAKDNTQITLQNNYQAKDSGKPSLHVVESDSDGEIKDLRHKEKPNQAVVDNREESRGFYLGQTVNVYDDEQHELCPQEMVKNISQYSFAKHVCGMLNTGQGGSIYFGIDENSRVFGLELSRDEKDRFRLGVDQHMFNKISPVLLHSQFSINNYPVINPENNRVIPDRYVIEINVRGSKGSIYTMVDGACYYRCGSDTQSITRQVLRKLIVFEEEANYRQEIKDLQEQKKQLLLELNT